MALYRAVRDCPKCGARKGFACHSFDAMPTCPQLERVPDPPTDDEMAALTEFLAGLPGGPDDQT